MPRAYSPQELEQLLFGLNSGTPILELAAKMKRQAGGVTKRMLALSRVNPATWNPERVVGYVREQRRQRYHEGGGRERQRRYILLKEFSGLEPVLNSGYYIGAMQLVDGQLRIRIDEEGIDMDYAADDFRDVVGKLPYNVKLNFSYEGNVIIFSPDYSERKRDINHSMRFLEALKYAFERRYPKGISEPTP